METEKPKTNILELKDEIGKNTVLKINGAEIHRIQEYSLKREPFGSVSLELKISIDTEKSSIDIRNQIKEGV